MPSPEENKDIARRWFNALNNGDVDGLAQLVDENLVDHTPMPGQPGAGRGREQHRQFIQGFRNAFPDWQETIDFMTAEGDRVVIHHTGTGIHRGAFMGRAPTNKQITVQAVNTIRISEDGRVVEHWGTNPWRGPV